MVWKSLFQIVQCHVMGRFNYNLRISSLKDVQLFRHEANDEVCNYFEKCSFIPYSGLAIHMFIIVNKWYSENILMKKYSQHGDGICSVSLHKNTITRSIWIWSKKFKKPLQKIIQKILYNMRWLVNWVS